MSNVGVYTSQNIVIDFRAAGVGDRIAAFAIDVLIIVAYVILVSWALLDGLGINQEWIIIILYLPVLFYHFIFEYMMDGQSPGKRQMKIRVIKEEGQPANIGSFFLRWCLSPVDFLLSGGIAMTSIILTAKGQRLGDMAAGTIVVKEKKLDTVNKSFLRKTVDNSYEPIFTSVKVRLEQHDIDLIQEVLKVRLEHAVNEPSEKLRPYIEQKLEVKSEMTTVNFFHTVIRDFQYYNSDPD